MLTQYEQDLLKTIKKQDYIADIDLSNQEVGNFNEVKAAIAVLISESLILPCGNAYSKDYKKVFHVYTHDIGNAAKIGEKLRIKQVNSQKKSIIENLLKKLKDSGNHLAIKAELELIKSKTQKIQPKFFQLNHEEIASCYNWVIVNGASELKARREAKEAKEAMEIILSRMPKKKVA